MDAEKVELFLQATGSGIQEKLELLLEDQDTEEGLKTEWKDVEDAVSLLAKRQRRRDKLVINSSTPTPIIPPENVTKSPTINQKGNESSMLDELVKGMREMKLKLARLEEKGQPSAQPTIGGGQRPQSKEGFVHRCIWCDSTDHVKKDCDSFTDALKQRLVFFKDGKIHLTETGLPLAPNFGKGGMRKVVDDMGVSHAISAVEAAAYGLKVDPIEGVYDEIGDLWPNAMELAAKGKLPKDTLHEAGDCIRMETGWDDPVDALSVHAYITRCKAHEAMVEEKRRRENEDEGPSKRVTRSGGRQDSVPSQRSSPQVPQGPEAPMEEASMGKKEQGKAKGKSPSYKLQSDIEAATDLKKVLEERILNSKVEFTLGEVLGIAKRKFHEEIIDIIKRKRQTLIESVHPQGEEGSSKAHVIQVSNKKGEENVVGCYQSSKRGKQVSFAGDEDEYESTYKSHYSRTHWARATT